MLGQTVAELAEAAQVEESTEAGRAGRSREAPRDQAVLLRIGHRAPVVSIEWMR